MPGRRNADTSETGDDAPMVLRLVTLAVAQLLDFGTFVRMVRWQGAGAESNPLVSLMFVDYGLPLVAVAKIALVVLVSAIVAILAAHPGRQRVLAGAVLWAGIVAGLLGGASNAAAILR
jgi:hypothetical protein